MAQTDQRQLKCSVKWEATQMVVKSAAQSSSRCKGLDSFSPHHHHHHNARIKSIYSKNTPPVGNSPQVLEFTQTKVKY